MNFKHSKNLQSGHDGISKIQALSWSQNNMRLAVAQSDKKIALYDENGEKREAFSTKPFKVPL
jgi:intraflagellar transport protein 172